MKQKNTIVVDIDGTVSRVGDRLKYLQQEKKDWDAFYEHCDEDEPIRDISALVYDLWFVGYDIVFCTGRRESVRAKTSAWLHQHFPNNMDFDLLMRKDGDHRHDTEVKPELLSNNNLTPDNVFLILEDRDSMVNKLRELGYRVLQVAEGKF